MIYGLNSREEKTVAASTGINPFFVKDYLKAVNIYSFPQVEKAILLLNQYNLKAVGVSDIGTEDASLLKEMVYKIIAA